MKLPDYQFSPKRFEVRPGIEMSYLDEGPRNGEVVVMLHGNPSWSFYWRHLVNGLSDKYRCIVPDHVGMGFSDKPGDAADAQPRYDYTLQSRVDDLDALLKHLGIEGKVTLAVHDWGGMIGSAWALNHRARIARWVITNTSAFPLPKDKRMPWRIALGRDSRIGGYVIRKFNLFARGAAHFGTQRKLPASVRDAYTQVYDGWDNAIATVRFMQDIPLDERDRAWPLIEATQRALPGYANLPVYIAWGLRDFVFDEHFFHTFERVLPNAQKHAFKDAGHYVLEDQHEVIVPEVRKFLDTHPATPKSQDACTDRHGEGRNS